MVLPSSFMIFSHSSESAGLDISSRNVTVNVLFGVAYDLFFPATTMLFGNIESKIADAIFMNFACMLFMTRPFIMN